MRIEFAGAQITDAVVEVIDDLQNDSDLTKCYIEAIDELTRQEILSATEDDPEDAEMLRRLKALQMIRKIIVTLSYPPDVDDPSNDIPTASY